MSNFLVETERRLLRSILGLPQYAGEVTASLLGHFFTAVERVHVFEAVEAALSEGVDPTPQMVAEFLASRGQDIPEGLEPMRVPKQTMLEDAATLHRAGVLRELAKQSADLSAMTAKQAEALGGMELGQVLELWRQVLSTVAHQGQRPITTARDVAAGAMERVRALTYNEATERRWRCGLDIIDNRFFIGPGHMCGFGAPSSHGKTTFLEDIQTRILHNYPGLGGAYISLADLSPEDLYLSALSKRSTVNRSKLMFDGLDRGNQSELDAVIAGNRRLLDDYGDRWHVIQSGHTVGQVLATIRRSVAKLRRDGFTPGVYVIDYAQVLELAGLDDEFKPIKVMAKAAAMLAKELDIAIIIATQMNTKGLDAVLRNDAKPQPNDLWGGTKIFNFAADIAVIIKGDPLEIEPRQVRNADHLTESLEYPPDWVASMCMAKLWPVKQRFGGNSLPADLHMAGGIMTYFDPKNSPATRWQQGGTP